MTSNEIRDSFLKYFEQSGHRIVRSSSLVPAGDPTLLFTNAGMNQFKDVFLGKEKRDYRRATSSQKCVRAGGKHNDLENVGRTARHHTFFEMLGNFSFGDYFKDEAISFAWKFLTEVIRLPEERMVATIFKGEEGVQRDEEAWRSWRRFLPAERIFELGMHDNFWAMGETGPCGPCSEVHYFQGGQIPCAEEEAGRACLGAACECDRWIEIWNLVFMQYNRDEQGAMHPLPAPCVDTGMGLERLAAVVQGKLSNYDTDLLQPLIQEAARLSGRHYGDEPKDDVSLRVIGDHVRAATFLISDGVLPSNEGRGYVLRKIVRRAARHGRMIGLEKPFLHGMVAVVCGLMGEAYPEIIENREATENVLRREEEVFGSTVAVGVSRLIESAEALKPPHDKVIPGEVLFKLYDTFGFPLDLAEEIARERGLGLDIEGFDKAMERQRELARQSWKGEMETQKGRELASTGVKSSFAGYDATRVDGAKCLLILKEGKRVPKALAGESVEIAFDRTPFYAESGGQVGDIGHVRAENGLLRVTNTRRPVEGLILCQAEVQEGHIFEGDAASLEVDEAARAATEAHHTSTHLLHAALREILGTHVKQAGSLVAPSHLRFDFHHFAPLEPEVIAAVEDRVNEIILENLPVSKREMALDDAVASGAMALFGEKYGDKVRVISVEGFSRELCGGTHVERTGDIGLFKINAERSVSSGVRRIEAVAHRPALAAFRAKEALLRETEAACGAPAEKLPEVVRRLHEDLRRIEKENSRLKLQLAAGAGENEDAVDVGGVRLMTRLVEGLDPSEAKNLADTLRQQIKSGVVVIGNRLGGKAALLVALTEDLTQKLKAVDLARELGKIIGGGGGGKADIAEAGGKKPEALEEALKQAAEVLRKRLG